MPEKDMPMMGGGLDEEESSSPVDEFETFALKAWPDLAGDPERLTAAKEAIRICVEQDQEGGYDEPKPPPKKGGVDLALIFGEPKKKKG